MTILSKNNKIRNDNSDTFGHVILIMGSERLSARVIHHYVTRTNRQRQAKMCQDNVNDDLITHKMNNRQAVALGHGTSSAVGDLLQPHH